ncbi:hypothetical protein ABIB14_000035 [Arthrobacter sp. UYEF3]
MATNVSENAKNARIKLKSVGEALTSLGLKSVNSSMTLFTGQVNVQIVRLM